MVNAMFLITLSFHLFPYIIFYIYSFNVLFHWFISVYTNGFLFYSTGYLILLLYILMLILSLVWPLGAPSTCLLLLRSQDLGVKCAFCYLNVTVPRQSWSTEPGNRCIDGDGDVYWYIYTYSATFLSFSLFLSIENQLQTPPSSNTSSSKSIRNSSFLPLHTCTFFP